METTGANKRKIRCLAAALIRDKIDSIELIEDQHQNLIEGMTFQSVLKAVAIAEKELSPRWSKQIKKMLNENGQWKPINKEGWLSFDEARKTNMRSRILIYERSCIVWSMVEVWTIACRSFQYHIQSTLTDEGWYAKYMNGEWVVIEGGINQKLPKNRNVLHSQMSSLTSRELEALPSKTWKKPNPILKAVLAEMKFI